VSAPQGVPLLFAGAVLMGLFVLHARRKGTAALIDLSLFEAGVFRAAAMTQFLSNAVLYGRQFVVPLFLIAGCALPVGEAGWLVAAVGLGMMCSLPVVGTLTERFGYRAVSMGGALLSMLGLLPFLWMIDHAFSPVAAAISLFAGGAGQGTIGIPSMSAAYASVPKARLAVANTAMNIVQRVGGPIATTAIAIVVAAAPSGEPVAGAHAFMPAFLLLTGLHLLALASASRLPVRIQ
jgi:hypothetical protein